MPEQAAVKMKKMSYVIKIPLKLGNKNQKLQTNTSTKYWINFPEGAILACITLYGCCSLHQTIAILFA